MNEFDYIVVGSGSAGGVIAARLSENPSNRVLLLEAGAMDTNPIFHMGIGFYRGKPASMGWGFKTEPEPHLNGRQLDLPQGRVLGGSSSINGKMYMRGHPLDFDEWAQMGCKGWGYDDVLPYFKRSERSWRGSDKYHNDGGQLEVTAVKPESQLRLPWDAAARELGYPVTDDFNAAGVEGFGSGDTTVDRRGRRASTARAFVRPALNRSNLNLITSALTRRVLVEKGRAIGVEYEAGGSVKVAHAVAEVIISAGAYNSPKLLLLSGIGPADELSAMGVSPLHDLPGVGRNIQDHAAIWVANTTRFPTLPVQELRADRVAINFLKWLVAGKGFFASQQCSAQLMLRTREGLERPDIQVMCNGLNHTSQIWWPGINPQPYIIQAGIGLLRPQSRGWVKLRSADPRDPPRIQLNILAERADTEVFLRSIRQMREIFASKAMQPFLGAEMVPGPDARTDEQLIEFMRANMQTARHPVGGCKMGIQADAVVDPELKVHGIDGLRVADSSIMPTIPGANTNAPAIMIGEKLSDMIKGRASGAGIAGRQ